MSTSSAAASARNTTTNNNDNLVNQMRDETWALCAQGMNAMESSKKLREKFADNTPIMCTIYKWRKEFRGGKGERQVNRDEEDQNRYSKEDGPKPPKMIRREVEKYCETCNRELCHRKYYEQHMLKYHDVLLGDSKAILDMLMNIPERQRENLIFRCDACIQLNGYLDFASIEELQAHKLHVHGQTMRIPNWKTKKNKLRTLSSSPTSFNKYKGSSNSSSNYNNNNIASKVKQLHHNHSTSATKVSTSAKNAKSRKHGKGEFLLNRRQFFQRDISLPSRVVEWPPTVQTGLRRSSRIPKPRAALNSDNFDLDYPGQNADAVKEDTLLSNAHHDHQQPQRISGTSTTTTVEAEQIKQEERETVAEIETALALQEKQQNHDEEMIAVDFGQHQNTVEITRDECLAQWNNAQQPQLSSPVMTNSSNEVEQGSSSEMMTPRTMAAAVVLCKILPTFTIATNAAATSALSSKITTASPAAETNEKEQRVVEQQHMEEEKREEQLQLINNDNANNKNSDQVPNNQQQHVDVQERFVTILNDGRIETEEPEMQIEQQQQQFPLTTTKISTTTGSTIITAAATATTMAISSETVQQQQTETEPPLHDGKHRQRMLSPAALDAADSMLKLARAAAAFQRSSSSTSNIATSLNFANQSVSTTILPSSRPPSSTLSSYSSPISQVPPPNAKIVALEVEAEPVDEQTAQNQLENNDDQSQENLEEKSQQTQHSSLTSLHHHTAKITVALEHKDSCSPPIACNSANIQEDNLSLVDQADINMPSNSNPNSIGAIDTGMQSPSTALASADVMVAVPQDDCTWFGHSIAAQLRMMSPPRKELAKIRLQRVIFECNLAKENQTKISQPSAIPWRRPNAFSTHPKAHQENQENGNHKATIPSTTNSNNSNAAV